MNRQASLAFGLLLLAALPAVAQETPKAAPPPVETLTYGRFGKLAIYRRAPHPGRVALFFSGDGGWNQGVMDMAAILADMDTLVVGISTPEYVRRINAARETCTYAAADFELLSKYVQKTLGLPTYVPPVLVGYSSGATLVYAGLVQAPPNTFRGAISMGFCPDLPLKHPFCSGHGIASVPLPNGKGIVFQPATTLEQTWIAFEGASDKLCPKNDLVKFASRVKNAETVLLPDVGHGFAKKGKWVPQFQEVFERLAGKPPARPAVAVAQKGPGVSDLPLVEVPAQAPGQGRRELAVILSGDGGWAGLDREVAGALSARGVPVVGLNSLQYFWTPRRPEGAARDLERILRHYLAAWKREDVLLIGYSLGADVLPFLANRLPADLLGRVRMIALLGPSHTANFEFHVAEWLGGGDPGLPVLPEVKKLAGRLLLCLHGRKEDDSLCPDLPAGLGKSVELPGAHHFGGDYEAVAGLILREAQGG